MEQFRNALITKYYRNADGMWQWGLQNLLEHAQQRNRSSSVTLYFDFWERTLQVGWSQSLYVCEQCWWADKDYWSCLLDHAVVECDPPLQCVRQHNNRPLPPPHPLLHDPSHSCRHFDRHIHYNDSPSHPLQALFWCMTSPAGRALSTWSCGSRRWSSTVQEGWREYEWSSLETR